MESLTVSGAWEQMDLLMCSRLRQTVVPVSRLGYKTMLDMVTLKGPTAIGLRIP